MGKQSVFVLALLATLLVGTSCVPKAPKAVVPPPTANSLIGLTKQELVALFGEAMDARPASSDLYGILWNDGDWHLNAFLRDEKVVKAIVFRGHSLKLDSGIGCDSSLEDVVGAYGEVTSEQDIAEGLKASDYSARTLYHVAKDGSYNLWYPEPSLFFIFGADRKVRVFSVGEFL